MAEGAPLLREYTVMSCIKGSNPFVSAKQNKATFWVAFLFLLHRSTFDDLCILRPLVWPVGLLV